MQETPLLNLEMREEIGGGKVNKLRLKGYIPAIIYGKGMDSLPVKIKLPDLRTALSKYGRNTIFNANLPGQNSFPIVIKEIQNDIITGEMIHADLQKISLTEVRRAEVPVRIYGRELLETSQMIVIQQMDEIMVKCLPQDTPQFIKLDVSKMTSGDSITAGQIELPEGVTLDSDPDQIVAIVTEVKDVVEETEKGETEEETIGGDES